MMKSTMTMSLAVMAVMVGLGGVSASANAQDMRHGRDEHGPVKVVVVQRPAPQRVSLFNRLDSNHNGAVDRMEFSQHYGSSRMARQTFRRIDLNHSGKLSQQEVAAGRSQLRALRG